MTLQPRLVTHDRSTGLHGIVLLLHGGRARSLDPSPRAGLAYLRMLPFARAIGATTDPQTAVWRLRYRYRGWNEPDEHPVQDARWALDRARREHPGVPVVLVGHSMGGRTALRVADAPGVAGICALAPWIEEGEPVRVPNGMPVLIAHGDRDHTTDPRLSARHAVLIGARYLPVHGDGHAMLRRPAEWSRLVTTFVRTILG